MVFPRLEELRTVRRMSLEEIAAVLSCKREMYRRYEKGITKIPIWAVYKLADYYNTSMDYILGLTDNPEPYERTP